MRFPEIVSTITRPNTALLIAGLILFLFGLVVNPVDILRAIGFPVKKLYGERGQTDLAIFHVVFLAGTFALVASQIFVWKNPNAPTKIAAA